MPTRTEELAQVLAALRADVAGLRAERGAAYAAAPRAAPLAERLEVRVPDGFAVAFAAELARALGPALDRLAAALLARPAPAVTVAAAAPDSALSAAVDRLAGLVEVLAAKPPATVVNQVSVPRVEVRAAAAPAVTVNPTLRLEAGAVRVVADVRLPEVPRRARRGKLKLPDGREAALELE